MRILYIAQEEVDFADFIDAVEDSSYSQRISTKIAGKPHSRVKVYKYGIAGNPCELRRLKLGWEDDCDGCRGG
jgi:hypothetical protein